MDSICPLASIAFLLYRTEGLRGLSFSFRIPTLRGVPPQQAGQHRYCSRLATAKKSQFKIWGSGSVLISKDLSTTRVPRSRAELTDVGRISNTPPDIGRDYGRAAPGKRFERDDHRVAGQIFTPSKQPIPGRIVRFVTKRVVDPGQGVGSPSRFRQTRAKLYWLTLPEILSGRNHLGLYR